VQPMYVISPTVTPGSSGTSSVTASSTSGYTERSHCHAQTAATGTSRLTKSSASGADHPEAMVLLRSSNFWGTFTDSGNGKKNTYQKWLQIWRLY